MAFKPTPSSNRNKPANPLTYTLYQDDMALVVPRRDLTALNERLNGVISALTTVSPTFRGLIQETFSDSDLDTELRFRFFADHIQVTEIRSELTSHLLDDAQVLTIDDTDNILETISDEIRSKNQKLLPLGKKINDHVLDIMREITSARANQPPAPPLSDRRVRPLDRNNQDLRELQNQLAKLESRLDEADRTKSELENSLGQAEQSAAEAQTRIEELSHEARESRLGEAAARTEANELRGHYQDKLREIEELQLVLEEAEAEVANKEKQLQSASERFEILQSEIEDIRQDFEHQLSLYLKQTEDLNRNCVEANGRLTAALSQLEEASQINEELRQQLDSLNPNLNSLQKERAELQQLLQQSQERENSANGQLLDQRALNKQLQNQIDQISETESQLRAKIQEIQTSLQQEQEANSLNSTDRDRFATEVDRLGSLLEESETRNQSFSSDLESLQQRLNEFELLNQEAETEILGLKQEVTRLTQITVVQAEALEESMRAFEQEKSALETRLQDSQKALELAQFELTEALAQAQVAKETAEEEAGTLRLQLQELQSTNNQQAEQYTELSRNLAQAEENQSLLNEKIVELAEQSRVLESQRAEKAEQISSLKQLLAQQTETLQTTQTTIAELQQRIAQSEQQINQLQEEITSLRETLAQQEKLSEQNQLASDQLSHQITKLESAKAQSALEAQELREQLATLSQNFSEQTGQQAEQIKSLEAQLSEAEERASSSQQELERLRQRLSEQEKLSQQNEQRNQLASTALNRQIEELESAKAESASETQGLREQIEKLSQNYSEQNGQLEEQIRSLEGQLEETERREASSQEELSLRNQELEALRKTTNQQNTEIQFLKDKLEQQTKTHEAGSKIIEQSIKEHLASIERLKKESAQNLELRTKLESRMETAAEEHRQSEETLSSLQAELEQVNSEKTTAQDEIEQLRGELRNSSELQTKTANEVEHLKLLLQEAQETQNTMRDREAELSQKIKELELHATEVQAQHSKELSELNRQLEEARIQKEEADQSKLETLEKLKKSNQSNEQLRAEIQALQTQLRTLTETASKDRETAASNLSKATKDLDAQRKLTQKLQEESAKKSTEDETAIASLKAELASTKKLLAESQAQNKDLQAAAERTKTEATKALTQVSEAFQAGMDDLAAKLAKKTKEVQQKAEIQQKAKEAAIEKREVAIAKRAEERQKALEKADILTAINRVKAGYLDDILFGDVREELLQPLVDNFNLAIDQNRTAEVYNIAIYLAQNAPETFDKISEKLSQWILRRTLGTDRITNESEKRLFLIKALERSYPTIGKKLTTLAIGYPEALALYRKLSKLSQTEKLAAVRKLLNKNEEQLSLGEKLFKYLILKNLDNTDAKAKEEWEKIKNENDKKEHWYFLPDETGAQLYNSLTDHLMRNISFQEKFARRGGAVWVGHNEERTKVIELSIDRALDMNFIIGSLEQMPELQNTFSSNQQEKLVEIEKQLSDEIAEELSKEKPNIDRLKNRLEITAAELTAAYLGLDQDRAKTQACGQILLNCGTHIHEIYPTIWNTLSENGGRAALTLAKLIYLYSALDHINPQFPDFAGPDDWYWLTPKDPLSGQDRYDIGAARLILLTRELQDDQNFRGSALSSEQVKWASLMHQTFLTGEPKEEINAEGGAGKTSTLELMGRYLPKIYPNDPEHRQKKFLLLAPFASKLEGIATAQYPAYSGQIPIETPTSASNYVVAADEGHKLREGAQIVVRSEDSTRPVNPLLITATPVVPANRAYEAMRANRLKGYEDEFDKVQGEIIHKTAQIAGEQKRAKHRAIGQLAVELKAAKEAFKQLNKLQRVHDENGRQQPQKILTDSQHKNFDAKIHDIELGVAQYLQNECEADQNIRSGIRAYRQIVNDLRKEVASYAKWTKQAIGKKLESAEALNMLISDAVPVYSNFETALYKMESLLDRPAEEFYRAEDLKPLQDRANFLQEKIQTWQTQQAAASKLSASEGYRRGFSQKRERILTAENVEVIQSKVMTATEGNMKLAVSNAMNQLGLTNRFQLIFPGITFKASTFEKHIEAIVSGIRSKNPSGNIYVLYQDSHSSSDNANYGKKWVRIYNNKGALIEQIPLEKFKLENVQKQDIVGMLYDSTNQQGGDFIDASRVTANQDLGQCIFYNLSDDGSDPLNDTSANDTYQAIRRRRDRNEISKLPHFIFAKEDKENLLTRIDRRQEQLDHYMRSKMNAKKIAKKVIKIEALKKASTMHDFNYAKWRAQWKQNFRPEDRDYQNLSETLFKKLFNKDENGEIETRLRNAITVENAPILPIQKKQEEIRQLLSSAK